MDEIIGGVVVFGVLICMVMFVGFSTLDRTFVDNCKTNGYHQIGQTRIICHIEEIKK